MLDAIHYLAFTKSAFFASDSQNINEDEPYFLVEGSFEPGNIQIKCYQERNQKKVIQLNQIDVDKVTDFIGNVPLILSTPYDSSIIRNSSEVRRKFIDGTISQHDADFLKLVLQFNRTFRQRNQFLKNKQGRLTEGDFLLLDVYDNQVIDLSIRISRSRKKFLDSFIDYFTNNYKQLTHSQEVPIISFSSDCLNPNFSERFRKNRNSDLQNMRTQIGAHKDDFVFVLDEKPVRKFGSQGQQKSFWLALRLAQYDYLNSIKDTKPILLLDDVFDKLDDKRIGNLVNLLSDEQRFGQVIITDARKERSYEHFKSNSKTRFIEIQDSEILVH